MDKNKIILIVLIVIIALIAAVALMPNFSKQDSQLKITSSDRLYEGEILSFKLVDLNFTPIQKQDIKIIVTDEKGDVAINQSEVTDSNGNVILDVNLTAGNYTVNVSYDGNENFKANSSQKNLTVLDIALTQGNDGFYKETPGGSVWITYKQDYYEHTHDYNPDVPGVQNMYRSDNV